MPKLTIDEQEIEVPQGTKVIQAAERLGIMIPRFCYHEALGSVGACRMCAVKFISGHKKKIDMSCMVEAEDGMVVSTTDPEAVRFRKFIIECLMLNHPHDCPVCDEGGHCLLQDETVSGGHGRRRTLGKKRTYHDQDLGPFIQHEMNRCIHCFRCSRFYQEYAGYRDLGVMQIGNREYFGRFESGALGSPFSGNLIDLCPTGVYTDKPARFKGRRWNFERGPSVCLHCSLGCNTIGSARYREMVRQEARFSEAINGHFICDRGRFGFDFANHPDRPRRARVGEREVPWQEGIRTVADRLRNIPGEAVRCLGSDRCSLETQAALKRMCRRLGWPDPRFFIEPGVEEKVHTAVMRLNERLSVSLRDLERADFLLGLGVDPLNEAPMLALAMRQAVRRGAAVAVVDPRAVSLPFSFSHLAVRPRDIDHCAAAMVRQAIDRYGIGNLTEAAARFYESLPEACEQYPDLTGRLEDLARKLGESKRPMVVCGTDMVRPNTVRLAADIAELLRKRSDDAGLFYVLPGPNAFGAGVLTSTREQESVLETLESERIQALILVEQDPLGCYPDNDRFHRALDKVGFCLVLDYLPSASTNKAHAVLPTVPHFERTPVRFVNQEGRVQQASPIHRGGTPLSQISGGNHPPRTFLDHVPGGDPKAAHEVLAEICAAVSGETGTGLLKDLREWLAREHPVFNGLSPRLHECHKVLPKMSKAPMFSWEEETSEPPKAGLELLLTHWTFGTEALSAYSRHTHKGEAAPLVMMHPDDAARLNLTDQDKVGLHLDNGEVVLNLSVSSNVAPGVLVLPRHRRINWQQHPAFPSFIPDHRIRKVEVNR